MSERKLDNIPIRFNARDQQRLSRALDAERKIATQLKEFIFKGIEGASAVSQEKGLPDSVKLEALVRERFERITSLLSMLVERMDEQSMRIESIAADVARSKLVVENIQDYLASDEGDGGEDGGR